MERICKVSIICTLHMVEKRTFSIISNTRISVETQKAQPSAFFHSTRGNATPVAAWIRRIICVNNDLSWGSQPDKCLNCLWLSAEPGCDNTNDNCVVSAAGGARRSQRSHKTLKSLGTAHEKLQDFGLYFLKGYQNRGPSQATECVVVVTPGLRLELVSPAVSAFRHCAEPLQGMWLTERHQWVRGEAIWSNSEIMWSSH